MRTKAHFHFRLVRIQLTLCAVGLVGVARSDATPHDDIAFNRDVRAQAAKLFLSHKDDDAVTYLTNNLRIARGGDPNLEVVQQLTTIAFSFYNRRDQLSAASVANKAASIASSYLKPQNPDGVRSSMLTNLGRLEEIVVHDPDAARAAYSAALTAQPTNEQAKAAIAQLDATSQHHR